MVLKDKRVLITGASRGIGRAAALALLHEGAHVFLAARSESALERMRSTLPASEGSAYAGRLDVSDPTSIRAGVQQALNNLGGIDILINNAGITSQAFVADQDPEQAAREVTVNYLGTYRVTQAVLPHMRKREIGWIVNVASTIGCVHSPTQANYSATKAAVIAFSEALRGEVEDHGIRVVVFVPGHTRTDMVKDIRLDAPQSMSAEEAASHLVRALHAGRSEYICGGMNRGIIRLHRLFPEAARRIMKSISLNSFAPRKAESPPA